MSHIKPEFIILPGAILFYFMIFLLILFTTRLSFYQSHQPPNHSSLLKFLEVLSVPLVVDTIFVFHAALLLSVAGQSGPLFL